MTEHVLIIRLSAIGDVAMVVPVVFSAAKQYPNVHFTVLSKPFARPFFDGLAHNVSFMGADVKGEYHGVHGLNKLYRRLMAKNFTAIADLHDVLRSKYLRTRFNFSFTDSCRVAHINKHRGDKHRLCAYNNKVKQQLPTSFQNYCDVFAELGYPVKLDFKSIFPEHGGDMSVLPEAFRSDRPQGQKWIGIAPFAAHEWKVYPLEMMEQVIALLTKAHPSCRIFFFGGGKKEMDTFDEWCSRYPQCTNASAALGGLYNELVLMSHLDVMLSMDSGNMHMAAITGIPVVSVWGATHVFAGFAPWGQPKENIVEVDLPCRPCSVYGNKTCRRGDFACMRTISPETIVRTLESKLFEKPSDKVNDK